MMKTMAIVNQKGGCGKTTTAVNLAAALAEQRQEVLLLDLDPQAHATIGLGQDPDELKLTLYDALTRPAVKLPDVLIPTKIDRLTLAPSSVILASADIELARTAGREPILSNLFKSVWDRFDSCVMDCAPSFGILTIGALIASTDVLVPVQAHYYSIEGLRRVLETIHLIRQRLGVTSAGNLHILLTLVEDRTTLSRQIQAQIREIFDALVLHTVIHNNVRLLEAPSAGEPVLTYAPRSRGALEYRALAAEILGNVPAVEAVGRGPARRGIQRDLSKLFGLGPGEREQFARRPDPAPVPRESEKTSTRDDGLGPKGTDHPAAERPAEPDARTDQTAPSLVLSAAGRDASPASEIPPLGPTLP
jgi:chromosome partitioning protein